MAKIYKEEAEWAGTDAEVGEGRRKSQKPRRKGPAKYACWEAFKSQSVEPQPSRATGGMGWELGTTRWFLTC